MIIDLSNWMEKASVDGECDKSKFDDKFKLLLQISKAGIILSAF